MLQKTKRNERTCFYLGTLGNEQTLVTWRIDLLHIWSIRHPLDLKQSSQPGIVCKGPSLAESWSEKILGGKIDTYTILRWRAVPFDVHNESGILCLYTS